MAKHNDEELDKILNDANKAKEELHKVVQKLYDAGYVRKARAGASLIYRIEEWQNRGA